MKFKLPKLTTDVDCEPLGYPGIVFVCWLNPPVEEFEAPDGKGEPWETPWYFQASRFIERVVIPTEYLEDEDEDLVVETDTAEAVYRLEQLLQDADPQILVWAIRAYGTERQDRLRTETKN